MDKDFVEIPRWVRILSDRCRFGGPGLSRQDFRVLERLLIVCAVILFAVSFAVGSGAKAQVVRMGAFVEVLCAYFVSANVRFMDKYELWPGAKNAPPPKPRTWRTTIAEYTFFFGVGLCSVVVVIWLAG